MMSSLFQAEGGGAAAKRSKPGDDVEIDMREEAQRGRVSGSVQRVSFHQIITDNLTQLFICQENNLLLIYIYPQLFS